MILNKPLSVILLAEPGYIRDGIVTILRSYPVIESVVVSPELYFPGGACFDLKVDVLLVDCTSRQAALQWISWVRCQSPDCRVVAIVKQPDQVEAARKAGAKGVVVEGFSGQDLLDAIQETYQEQVGVA